MTDQSRLPQDFDAPWRRRSLPSTLRFRRRCNARLGLSHRVAAINLRRLVNLDLDHQGGWVLAT